MNQVVSGLVSPPEHVYLYSLYSIMHYEGWREGPGLYRLLPGLETEGIVLLRMSANYG